MLKNDNTDCVLNYLEVCSEGYIFKIQDLTSWQYIVNLICLEPSDLYLSKLLRLFNPSVHPIVGSLLCRAIENYHADLIADYVVAGLLSSDLDRRLNCAFICRYHLHARYTGALLEAAMLSDGYLKCELKRSLLGIGKEEVWRVVDNVVHFKRDGYKEIYDETFKITRIKEPFGLEWLTRSASQVCTFKKGHCYVFGYDHRLGVFGVDGQPTEDGLIVLRVGDSLLVTEVSVNDEGKGGSVRAVLACHAGDNFVIYKGPHVFVVGGGGGIVTRFRVGEGVSSMVVDALGRIWLGYYLEHIMLGQDKDEIDLSLAGGGVVCVSEKGKLLYSFNDNTSAISECYSLSATPDGGVVLCDMGSRVYKIDIDFRKQEIVSSLTLDSIGRFDGVVHRDNETIVYDTKKQIILSVENNARRFLSFVDCARRQEGQVIRFDGMWVSDDKYFISSKSSIFEVLSA